MHDWVDELTAGQRVLDLGAATGSLRNYSVACMVVAVDSDTNAFVHAYPSDTTKHVYAQGEFLPFASGTFDLVLCQHVLEHIENPSLTLSELGRILKPNGRMYVAVPNGFGLCDGVYRYVFEGGGHVNRFGKEELVRLIEQSVDVRLVAWQNLHSSFVYLSRLPELGRDRSLELSPRLRRLTRIPEALVLWFQGSLYLFTRWAGRLARVNWAIYGWALFFERGRESKVQEYSSYVNVCLFCGDGHPIDTLTPRYLFFYRCPTCSRWTTYFPGYRGVA